MIVTDATTDATMAVHGVAEGTIADHDGTTIAIGATMAVRGVAVATIEGMIAGRDETIVDRRAMIEEMIEVGFGLFTTLVT